MHDSGTHPLNTLLNLTTENNYKTVQVHVP